MKKHPRTTVVYILLAAIPAAVVIFLIYWNIRQALINNQLAELGAIADLKIGTINNYFDALNGSLALTMASRNIKTDLPAISRDANNPSSTEYIQAKGLINPVLQSLLGINNIIDVELTNTSGTVVYVASPNMPRT